MFDEEDEAHSNEGIFYYTTQDWWWRLNLGGSFATPTLIFIYSVDKINDQLFYMSVDGSNPEGG